MTDHEKYECARRELAMHQRVYPTWVESGRMTQERADREIELMAAIADDYRATAEPSLFDREGKP